MQKQKQKNNVEMASKNELKKLQEDGLKRLENPIIRAVFERLKNK